MVNNCGQSMQTPTYTCLTLMHMIFLCNMYINVLHELHVHKCIDIDQINRKTKICNVKAQFFDLAINEINK